MRAWLGVAVGGLVLALATGCGSDDDGGGSGGGGGAGNAGGSGATGGAGGGAGGSGSINPKCQASCDAIAAINCPNDDPSGTCAQDCTDGLANATTCKTEIEAVADCAATATLSCNADGQANVFTACQTESQAVVACTACEPAAGDDACATCSKQNCCTETKDAYSDPDILAYRDCVAACTDATCIGGCGTQYPTAASKTQAYLTCLNDQCSNDCP